MMKRTAGSIWSHLAAWVAISALAAGCSAAVDHATVERQETTPYVIILGNAQDGGYPQAGCNRPHCKPGWDDPERRRFVSSIAVVDPSSGERWLFDATPDFPEQLRMLDQVAPRRAGAPILDGIFLTHAHIGHYTGLMHLGREVLGAKRVPVYAMPRMRELLEENGPWSQLVTLDNVSLRELADGGRIQLNERISVTPFLVPHRDEFSETVGYLIEGPSRRVAFVPDIDKWERWDRPIESLIASVDVALLDATFYADGEISRPISEVPHPFVSESIERFSSLPISEREKVWFIHLNHTNPALQEGTGARREVEAAGHRIAEQGDMIPLD